MNNVRDALFAWQFVRISGPSMVPTLNPGDLVLARWRVRIRPGDVVLATFRDLPGRWVVKRAVAPQGDGWKVASDNEFTTGDSATHGIADVHARVVLLWSRTRRGRRAIIPRRIAQVPARSDS